MLTEAQEKWMADNPQYSGLGPPRPVRFSEWGTLYADGTYERMDNQKGKAIRVGEGAVGVAIYENT